MTAIFQDPIFQDENTAREALETLRWFMMHRLREAMIVSNSSPMARIAATSRPDEAYHLNTSKRAKSYKSGLSNKADIAALLGQGTRTVRTIHVTKGVTANRVRGILVPTSSLTPFSSPTSPASTSTTSAAST